MYIFILKEDFVLHVAKIFPVPLLFLSNIKSPNLYVNFMKGIIKTSEDSAATGLDTDKVPLDFLND